MRALPACLLFLTVYAVSANFYVINRFDMERCRYEIQVSDGNDVFIAKSGTHPGKYGVRKCFDTGEPGCYLNSEQRNPPSEAELARQSFMISDEQVCFLENFKFEYGSNGCFSWYQPIFKGVSFKVSCEPLSSVPEYCGKSENYARQVLLGGHKAKCDSLGGEFDGGVYRRESGEYCVSGSCRSCGSDWRNKLIRNWKDSVCCGIREMEPNSNNGTCKDPAPHDSGKINMLHSRITAFPGCSSVPAGSIAFSHCWRPPQSSSSEHGESSSSGRQSSSSSWQSLSSSSEQMEEADCYAYGSEAGAALSAKAWQCTLEGKNSNYSIGEHGCISGGCAESGQCIANPAFKALKKETDIYGWVYMGKQPYVSVSERRDFPRYPGRHFDVLGRTYRNGKLPDASFYYLIDGNKIYKPKTIEEYSEIDVWARIIKDWEGRDIQAFMKKDEKRGYRKDSSFYYDGYWEVTETDNLSRTLKSNTSLGVKVVNLYDDKGRVTSNLVINKEGDTTLNHRYFWKDGRLVKTIFDGVERIYIYGKTLQDTVRVIPSDENIYHHSGYDNSVGKIPDEDDPKYRFFVLGPYSYGGYADKKNEKPAARLQNFAMQKTLQRKGYGMAYCGIADRFDMPEAQCVRYAKEDIPAGYEKEVFFPGSNGKETYGLSNFEFNSDGFECKCDSSDGLFRARPNNNIIINEHIAVFFSAWRYRKTFEQWEERCWDKMDMQLTYNHEAKHIENSRNYAKLYFDRMVNSRHKTEEECIKGSRDEIEEVSKEWELWKKKEIDHSNNNSPKRGGSRTNYAVNCD